ncbi:type 1 glutamine amidotransferase [Aquibium carbonis]|uniref:Type 1 glutamine amidotransferase n=1 Tax=Aquibium carbonis TaxID=2495581 RepID=A0A3R9Y6J3_9HYPH|nr:type 1 glutamine amidotransferase [Aquibium carbonis]RST85260.1 type 1 glutamine amidotransferase [Aquibium carbonis]
MRILVVQNYADTGLGQIAQALDEAEADVEVVMAHDGERLPSLGDGHDGLIVLGGAQNALADDDHPYLPALVALMRDFALADRAVLGVCLGSQLLARAFGARNLIGAAPEFGWREVALTREGTADPVLRVAAQRFPIFQWHDDTFTLPPGAIRLAGNEVAENQAFRIGRAAYGIQFHFEADTALVRHWSRQFAAYLSERQPGWQERLGGETARYGPAADATGLALARAWVALV